MSGVKVFPKGETLRITLSSGGCCNHVDVYRAAVLSVYKSIYSYVLALTHGYELWIVTKEQRENLAVGRADLGADMLQGLQRIYIPTSLGFPWAPP